MEKADVKGVLRKLTPYVDLAEDVKGKKVLVCSKCGFVYCRVEENFKLFSLIFERDPREIHPGRLSPDPEWALYREFYCPGCGVQTEVEVTPPGSPILWNVRLTDL